MKVKNKYVYLTDTVYVYEDSGNIYFVDTVTGSKTLGNLIGSPAPTRVTGTDTTTTITASETKVLSFPLGGTYTTGKIMIKSVNGNSAWGLIDTDNSHVDLYSSDVASVGSTLSYMRVDAADKNSSVPVEKVYLDGTNLKLSIKNYESTTKTIDVYFVGHFQ